MAEVKSGYMHKCGKSVKNWKKRWFVLKPNGYLYYYEGPGKGEKGKIDIIDAIRIAPWQEVGTAERKLPANLTGENSFAIVSGDRTYTCCCENDGESLSWMAAIEKVRGAASSQDQHYPPPTFREEAQVKTVDPLTSNPPPYTPIAPEEKVPLSSPSSYSGPPPQHAAPPCGPPLYNGPPPQHTASPSGPSSYSGPSPQHAAFPSSPPLYNGPPPQHAASSSGPPKMPMPSPYNVQPKGPPPPQSSPYPAMPDPTRYGGILPNSLPGGYHGNPAAGPGYQGTYNYQSRPHPQYQPPLPPMSAQHYNHAPPPRPAYPNYPQRPPPPQPYPQRLPQPYYRPPVLQQQTNQVTVISLGAPSVQRVVYR